MPKRKLLFIDDEPDFPTLIEQQFEDKIDEFEVTFVFARNGLEGLEKLKEHQDIEVVLADINMPVMDGLEFVVQAKQLDRLLKIIMVSAYSDMGNLRKAMNKGAYDFITKPIDFEELGETISRTLRKIDQFKIEEAELNRLREIEKEMEIAKKIITSLLPSPNSLPSDFPKENIEVSGTLGIAPVMRGCFYDFFAVDTTNKLALVVGEIEARGIAAAIYISSAREAIRRFANQIPDLIKCAKKINNYLYYQKTPEIPNFPLFLGFFNTLTGELEYVLTGMPPVIITSAEGKITEHTVENPLIGSSLNTETRVNKITLNKNETIVIHSNAIQKIKNKDDQSYPLTRLKELISAHHQESVASIIGHIDSDIHNFTAPTPPQQDYIILSLKFKGLFSNKLNDSTYY